MKPASVSRLAGLLLALGTTLGASWHSAAAHADPVPMLSAGAASPALPASSVPPVRPAESATPLTDGRGARGRPAPGDATVSLLALGRRAYLEGLDVHGAPLQAQLSQGMPLPAGNSACVSCHRRSGEGGLEGRILMPPITGPTLFRDGVFVPDHPGPPVSGDRGLLMARYQSRHAYTPETLRLALSAGRDPDGRALQDPMPRYVLDEPTAYALQAYLASLGSEPVASVDSEPFFWLVLTAGADPLRRDTVRRVVEAYARTLPPPARPWQIRVFDLAQDPSALETALHDGSPRPLALLSGAGADDWIAIDALCEREALPCVLPALAASPAHPADGPPRVYAQYLSDGLKLEARALLQRVRSDAHPACRAPLLVTAPEGAGSVVASPQGKGLAVAASQEKNSAVAAPVGSAVGSPADAGAGGALESSDPVVERDAYAAGLQILLAGLPDAQRATPAQLQASDSARCVVLWLPGRMARSVLASFPPPESEAAPWRIAMGLLPLYDPGVPVAWRLHVELISGLDAQSPLRVRALLEPWLRRADLGPVDLRSAADAYASCYLVQLALSEMEAERIHGMRVGPFSREELIEALEDVTNHNRTPGVPHYSPIRLGGVTRTAVRTAVALRYATAASREPELAARWLPD